KRTRTLESFLLLISIVPQQKLCDQKSLGSSPRREIVQSLTSGFQLWPPSVETSIWYFTSGRGGLPENTCAAAWTASTRSLRGGAISSVTRGVPNFPSTRCASACPRFGPAETTALPDARNCTPLPLSLRRGRTDEFAWQTVVIVRPDLASS